MAKYNMYVEDVSVEAVFNKLGGIGGAKRFLADEFTLVEKPKPELVPEPPLDFLIYADRSVRPSYPNWVKAKSINSREFVTLERTGPSHFNLETDIEEWLHDGQKNDGYVSGNTIYEHLKENKMLESCLGLADLFAIQAKGITVFRKLFQGKVVFGWKSVVQRDDGSLLVPYLYGYSGEVVVDWSYLGNDWRSSLPALRFSK